MGKSAMAGSRRHNSLTDQVVADLLELIRAEHYQPGQRLPPVDRLVEQMEVGRSTVREALRLLQARGVVEIAHGRGIFVSDPRVTRVTGALYGFTDILRQRGLIGRSQVLDAQIMPADRETARALQVRRNAPVNLLKRLRFVGDVPIGLETSLTVHARFPDLLQLDWTPETSLYALLQSRYGVIPTTATQRVSATLIGEEESRLLNVAPNSPALLVKTIAYDQEGKPFEYGYSRYCGERYDYYVHLKRE